MSRLEGSEAVLQAVDWWRQECLLEEGSIFGEESSLWTLKNFKSLQRHFVENPLEGSDSFQEKLKTQLEPAPPEAKCLWAEMTWLYYLIVSEVKPVTKLDRIKRVWEWSGDSLPENHWALGDVLGDGIVKPGAAYYNHQWREFSFMVALSLDWFNRPNSERRDLLGNPWEFGRWIDNQPASRGRQFRHALLYLLFPDTFEPIMSDNHKKKIINTFGDSPDDATSADRLDRIGCDRALQAICHRLLDENPGRNINFYRSPFFERWQSEKKPSADNSPLVPAVESVRSLHRFGAADFWIIAPGEGARLWEEFLDLGIAAIGWDFLGDLGEFKSRDDVHKALIESGSTPNPVMQSLAVWQFTHVMREGDILLARKFHQGPRRSRRICPRARAREEPSAGEREGGPLA